MTLDKASPDLHLDRKTGLPLHGLHSAVRGWTSSETGATRVAAFKDIEAPEFPFRHRIEALAEVSGATLSITTTVTATGDVAVPVAFGYHPYFVLPGVPRVRRRRLPSRGRPCP